MIKCDICGCEEIFYDDYRECLWCNGCGKLIDIDHKGYDWDASNNESLLNFIQVNK